MTGKTEHERAMNRRMAMIGRAGAALALGLGLGACGEDFAVVPVRNLERPSDMGFACLRVIDTAQGPQVSGRPMVECHDPDVMDPTRIVLNGRTQGTFGLATNTARGELAAIDFDVAEYHISPLIDLDTRNPGFNQLPVGSLPEVISVSDDGCQAVTANRGSCDLSLVDITRLMAGRFQANTPSTGEGRLVTHVRFQTGNQGVLRAAPFEVAFLPTGLAAGTSAEAMMRPAPVCRADGIPRDTAVVPWRALVTFPACDLVAMVDLPSGNIVSSVHILADGTAVDAGRDPGCAASCPGPNAGGPPPGTVGVSGLAVMPEGDRAYVAAARSAFVTVLDVGPQGLGYAGAADPAVGRVELAENPGGVTRLRLSVNPFGPTQPNQGKFVGMRGKFLYAFATDGSVRVIDLNRTPGGHERECDVNVDPAALFGAIDAPCVPVAEKHPRRLMADGPGMRIPVTVGVDVAPPAPVDIAFAQLNVPSSTGTTQAIATGFLMSSNGQLYHVAVEGYASSVEPATPPHNFRRLPPGQPGSSAGGFPSNSLEPDRQFTPNKVPFPTRVAFASRLDGPRLESFMTESRNTPTWVAFPRIYEGTPEDFGLIWEGDLPNTLRTTARIEPVAGGNALLDPGANFCRWGVQPGDVLTLIGCDQDADCDRDHRGLEVCLRASPGAQGVCLPRSFVADEERLRVCRAELSSRRRYEVRDVFRSRLTFAPKLDEVPQPRLYPCQNDLVCQPDQSHQRGALPGDLGFQCLKRAGEGTPRCLKACGTRAADGSWQTNDRLCRAGYVCADLGDTALGPLCVEAPAPRPECTPTEIPYRVQVGQGYLLSSNAVPFLGSQLEEASTDPWGGHCVPDPNQNPLFGQRIPLSAPHCKDVPDDPQSVALNVTKQSPTSIDGGWGNPCLFRAPAGDSGDGQDHVKALFENPHVRFVFTNLEQYVGDGTTIAVHIEGGFSPLRVGPSSDAVRFGLGVRILSSPIDAGATLTDSGTGTPPPYLFVIDQGRTTTSLSRGQILRVNPRPAQLFPGGFIDSANSNSLFPVQ